MAKLVHPYADMTGGAWLRGNLHTHSRQSDGDREPQRVIDDYAARGYGFLMFSDHDFYTPEESFRKWNSRDMVLIPGNEVEGDPHILHVDADRYMPPVVPRQDMLNNITAAAQETGRGFAIINHPNWMAKFDHCTIGQMLEWTGYLGIEIYNGVIGRLDGSQYALDKWDLLLSAGRRVWGFANDDSHRDEDVELGWNVAYVRERSVPGVVEALRNGRFYCSTGVVIKTIRVDGMRIILETENACRIVAVQDVGKRIAVTDSSKIEMLAPTQARYVRFECWGQGEKMAWTQPFFVETEPVA